MVSKSKKERVYLRRYILIGNVANRALHRRIKKGEHL